jgi:hypothetical protein
MERLKNEYTSKHSNGIPSKQRKRLQEKKGFVGYVNIIIFIGCSSDTCSPFGNMLNVDSFIEKFFNDKKFRASNNWVVGVSYLVAFITF